MLTDLNYFDVNEHFLDTFPPAAPGNIADQALRTVNAGDAAQNALRDIDNGTARPDQLADQLLALLVGVDDTYRADVVKGFLRPIAKRLETRSTTAAKVSGD